MRRPILAAVAAVSMIGASSAALAQSAAPLSIAAHTRAGADLQQPGNIRGGFILPTLAILAIAALIYVLTKNDNPSSP
jgi:hypothetical protein